jgi:hypothetical protein
MASSYYPKIVTSGMVLYLDAGNRDSYAGSGTTWRDLSGRGNNGTLVGGCSYDQGNVGSILFDGSTGYGNVPHSSTIALTAGTVGVWFKYTAASGGGAAIIGKVDSSTSLNGFNIVVAGGSVSAQLKNATTAWSVGGVNVNTSTWYNVTISFASNSTLDFYVNGSRTHSTSITSTLTATTQPLRISDSVDTAWSILGGNVSTALLYNRVLTAAEVAQNFNAHRGRFGV